jgi:fibronectin type 3 domain-containing protein
MARSIRSLLRLATSLLCVAAFAQPTVHQASLVWTQSTSSGVTGNCVYRSQVSGGPYTQLACSSTPSTSYVDSTVVGGQTYYYVVTALDGTEESAYSNQVQAVVPQSPNAPTGLSAVAQ